MEITIKINGRFMSVEVSAEVADYLEQAKRNNRKLYWERQRYWDGCEFDEYIIATEGRLPYCATPEELVCQRGSGFCPIRCTISAMRRLPRCPAVPKVRCRPLLTQLEKIFKNTGNRPIRTPP